MNIHTERDSGFIDLSIIIPCYIQNDSDILQERLCQYDAMPLDLKKRYCIIIVDDGSPKKITLPRLNLNLTLLRVLKDIPWNQPGARNLGICYAMTQKIFLTDIDHFIFNNTIEFCLNLKLSINDVFTFKRISDNEVRNPHPNTFLLRKDFFMRMNLYDEDFTVNYGNDDHFVRQFSFEKHNAIVRVADYFIEVYKQTGHNLIRDTKISDEKIKRKKGEHSKMVLRFPWEFVGETTVQHSAPEVSPPIQSFPSGVEQTHRMAQPAPTQTSVSDTAQLTRRIAKLEKRTYTALASIMGFLAALATVACVLMLRYM